MKLVHTSYRWLPGTFLRNLRGWYHDIRNGIGNLATFFEAVWWFDRSDWTGLAGLIEVSAREMRKDQELDIHVGAAQQAKRLLIVEQLCKRLQAEEYFRDAGYGDDWDKVPNYRQSQIAKHSHYMAKQDAEYLGKMFKFIQHWWS